MAIEVAALVGRIMADAPFEDENEVRLALDASLAALRGGLTDDEAAELSSALGPELAAALAAERFRGELSLEEFYDRVALYEGMRMGVAIEQAQVVWSALVEVLPTATVQLLREHLPGLAPLFTPRAAPNAAPAPEHVRSAPAPEHTLAAGRPGSTRPLSDARPDAARTLGTARPEPAHSQSVARSDDPHGDTKLSGAKGLTQERLHETLATARRSVQR